MNSSVIDTVHLGSDRRNHTAALLPADEGQITLVQAASVVGINKVNARKLVLNEDLTVGNGRHRPGLLDLERRGRTSLMHNCSLS